MSAHLAFADWRSSHLNHVSRRCAPMAQFHCPQSDCIRWLARTGSSSGHHHRAPLTPFIKIDQRWRATLSTTATCSQRDSDWLWTLCRCCCWCCCSCNCRLSFFFGAESVFCCTRFGHRKALVCVWWTTNAWVLLLLLQQFHHLLRAPESSVVMQQHSWLSTRWWREWRRRLLLLWSAVDPFKLNALVSLRRERESSTIECIQISSLPNLSLSRRLLQIVDHRCGGSRSSSSFLFLTYLAASQLSFTARLLFLCFNNN